MITADKKLLKLAVAAYENKQLDKFDRINFARDHRQYLRKELTFRELMESIRHPGAELKKALENYYKDTNYKRVFKNAK